MFTLSSISNDLRVWSVNHTSIYENSELNIFKYMQSLGEIYNWPNYLLGINVKKTLESCW